MMKRNIKWIVIIIFTLLAGCSVIYISNSDSIKIEKTENADFSGELDLNRKDSIK